MIESVAQVMMSVGLIISFQVAIEVRLGSITEMMAKRGNHAKDDHWIITILFVMSPIQSPAPVIPVIHLCSPSGAYSDYGSSTEELLKSNCSKLIDCTVQVFLSKSEFIAFYVQISYNYYANDEGVYTM